MIIWLFFIGLGIFSGLLYDTKLGQANLLRLEKKNRTYVQIGSLACYEEFQGHRLSWSNPRFRSKLDMFFLVQTKVNKAPSI